jgi:hypothetical protein
MADLKERENPEIRRLLGYAKADFMHSWSCDSASCSACYNLALIAFYEGDLEGAVGYSERILRVQENIPYRTQEKFLADVYVNLACFHAAQARNAADANEKARLEELAVSVCARGNDYVRNTLKSAAALRLFRESLQRELGENGDFAKFSQERRQKLRAML